MENNFLTLMYTWSTVGSTRVMGSHRRHGDVIGSMGYHGVFMEAMTFMELELMTLMESVTPHFLFLYRQ